MVNFKKDEDDLKKKDHFERNKGLSQHLREFSFVIGSSIIIGGVIGYTHSLSKTAGEEIENVATHVINNAHSKAHPEIAATLVAIGSLLMVASKKGIVSEGLKYIKNAIFEKGIEK